MRSGGGGDSRQVGGNKRTGNILSNAAYSIFSESSWQQQQHATTGHHQGLPPVVPAATGRRLKEGSTSFLQRSTSADNVQIVRQRGFKPSDRHDPAKRNFLESLTSKILHFDMDSGHSTPIDLQKLLTPASDYSQSSMQLQKNKKMYASSYFYSPNHPTVEDQVELARRISSSLSDVKNVKSKGQSMYVNRKKRSVKWIHDGDGQEDEQQQSQPTVRDKLPLKCMMNPGGKLLDYRGVQALGEEPNITPPHPERLYDIVRDLNNQKGRGAEIFAKRRKRSEKWVVDAAAIPDQHQQQQQPQSPSSFGYPPKVKDHNLDDHHLNFQHKPFYEPFDLPNMDYSSPVLLPNCSGHRCSRASFGSAHSDCGPYAHEPPIRRIYLREVAVGTEPENLARRPNAINGRAARNKPQHHSSQHARHGHPHPQIRNGYNYLNGQPHQHHHYNAYHNGAGCRNGYQNGYQNASPGYQNGYQNGSPGYQNASAGYQNGYQNGSPGYQNGYQNGADNYQQQNYMESPAAFNEENQAVEDYTPVPVKQLIQEFEKTCRPVMQLKQYPSRSAPLNSASQNDLSRYFQSRRQVVYHNRRPDAEQLDYAGYDCSSAGDDEQDDEEDEDHVHRGNGCNGQQQQQRQNEDDDEDEGQEEEDDDDDSLDDSLSPVDFYRVQPTNNRSSSMSTVDEYYRRQLQQYPRKQNDKNNRFVDSEAEVHPGVKAANLAAVASQRQVVEKKKDLRKTPVLENLVAGTTTPECFKQSFTEEIATKLSDNLYHGPKISSYQNLTNYNTAPRGWDQSQKVYRPIRFEKPQDTKISYSDF